MAMSGRYLTFNAVIRVNQIEATRTLDLGEDERRYHNPVELERMRDAIERGWPGGRMTWTLTWKALTDQSSEYRSIRTLIAEYHRRYGDDVTFLPGAYFANAHNDRAQVDRDLHEGLELASAIVGGRYRPKSVVAGFLSAQNHQFLAEHEGIHVCQGNVWSQYH